MVRQLNMGENAGILDRSDPELIQAWREYDDAYRRAQAGSAAAAASRAQVGSAAAAASGAQAGPAEAAARGIAQRLFPNTPLGQLTTAQKQLIADRMTQEGWSATSPTGD